jgi:hypothetical protein
MLISLSFVHPFPNSNSHPNHNSNKILNRFQPPSQVAWYVTTARCRVKGVRGRVETRNRIVVVAVYCPPASAVPSSAPASGSAAASGSALASFPFPSATAFVPGSISGMKGMQKLEENEKVGGARRKGSRSRDGDSGRVGAEAARGKMGGINAESSDEEEEGGGKEEEGSEGDYSISRYSDRRNGDRRAGHGRGSNRGYFSDSNRRGTSQRDSDGDRNLGDRKLGDNEHSNCRDRNDSDRIGSGRNDSESDRRDDNRKLSDNEHSNRIQSDYSKIDHNESDRRNRNNKLIDYLASRGSDHQHTNRELSAIDYSDSDRRQSIRRDADRTLSESDHQHSDRKLSAIEYKDSDRRQSNHRDSEHIYSEIEYSDKTQSNYKDSELTYSEIYNQHSNRGHSASNDQGDDRNHSNNVTYNPNGSFSRPPPTSGDRREGDGSKSDRDRLSSRLSSAITHSNDESDRRRQSNCRDIDRAYSESADQHSNRKLGSGVTYHSNGDFSRPPPLYPHSIVSPSPSQSQSEEETEESSEPTDTATDSIFQQIRRMVRL